MSKRVFVYDVKPHRQGDDVEWQVQEMFTFDTIERARQKVELWMHEANKKRPICFCETEMFFGKEVVCKYMGDTAPRYVINEYVENQSSLS